MKRNPAETKTRLLDAAEQLVLHHGFAGTTVDAVIELAGLTKGAFFHHFDSKSDLAQALIERYAALDRELLETTMERSERLSKDPLQQVQIFVGLLEEKMETLTEPYPGCLFASYCYQNQLFDDRTLAVGESAFRLWRERIGDKLRESKERYPRLAAVDTEALADMLTGILEGAFLLSRVFDDPGAVARQLSHYRNYLELLTQPAPALETVQP